MIVSTDGVQFQPRMATGAFVFLASRALYSSGELSCDDHCYHEFGSLRLTLDIANDEQRRSIGEFLIEVVEEAKRGWQVFDPYDSQGSLGSFLVSRISVSG